MNDSFAVQAIGEAANIEVPTLGHIRQIVTNGDIARARSELRRLVQLAPTNSNISSASRMWASLESEGVSLDEPALRLALVGSGTLEPLGAQLRVAIAGLGIQPFLHVGQFDQWPQELLATDGPLYQFGPHIILVAISTEALFPRTAVEAFVSEEDASNEREHGIATLMSALRAARRSAPDATIILNTFGVPDYSPLGIADLQMDEQGQRERIEQINRAVGLQVKSELPSVVLFDIERVEARFGKMKVRDFRRWYVAGVPFSDDFSRFLALEYIRVIRPIKGLIRKCVVVDLDNTLWGGVVGEDGPMGVRVGGTAAPGNAFRDLQVVLENLRRRGILLAVCSKNNESDALEAITRHPGMLLKPSSFSALRVNWSDKASNISSIAQELNIGLDSIVFLDDNPAERALVRERLPDVLVVEMPRDPAFYASIVAGLDVFEFVKLTEEDRRRSELYAEQRQRAEFERSHGLRASAGMKDAASEPGRGASELHGYLFDLSMRVELAEATDSMLARVAQLINKTNQFNLTTRRYTEAEVREMAREKAAFGIYTVHLADRFGDSGLTGIAIVRKYEVEWEVDTFLLSCRILGRGVERSFLRYIALTARNGGADSLLGRFIKSSKNAPASDFFPKMGLTPCMPEDSEDGAERWRLDLSSGADLPEPLASYPEWLQVNGIGQNKALDDC